MQKVYIKDDDGNKVLPITNMSAVKDDNGNSLESIWGAFKDSVEDRLDEQDAELSVLNGNEVIVVEDHTDVTNPVVNKIYREQGSTTYTDYMWYNNAWKEIATYSFPGIDDEPTADSANLVKSGGVAAQFSQLGQEVGKFSKTTFLTAGVKYEDNKIYGDFHSGEKIKVMWDGAGNSTTMRLSSSEGSALTTLTKGNVTDVTLSADYTYLSLYSSATASQTSGNVTFYLWRNLAKEIKQNEQDIERLDEDKESKANVVTAVSNVAFSTSEKVKEVALTECPDPNSAGLVKSYGIFNELKKMGLDTQVVSTNFTASTKITSDGDTASSGSAKCSDFIQIDKLKRYLVISTSVASWYAAFYSSDSLEGFISSQQYPEAPSATSLTEIFLNIPADAEYMRVTIGVNVTGGNIYTYEISDIGKKVEELERTLVGNNLNFAGVNEIGFLTSPALFDADLMYIPMYGQSYTVCNDGGYKITNNFDANVFMHGTTNPLGVGDTTIRPLSTGANEEYVVSDFGSIFSKLLKQYCWKSQDILIGSYGQGSRSIKELSPDNGYGYGYHTYEDVFEPGVQNAVTAAQNANKSIVCPFILFLQGESDVKETRSGGAAPDSSCLGNKDEYKQCMLSLKTSMQNTIMQATGQDKAPIFIVYTTGNASFNSQKCGVQQAVLELCEENEDIFTVGSYYYMTSMGAHPSPDGRRWLAELFAKQVFEIYVRSNETTMRVVNSYIDNGDIVLNVKTATPPLVFDTWTYPVRSNYGFKLYSESAGVLTEITLTSVSIEDGNTIRLHTEVDLDGLTLLVTYGNSSVSGGGNLRDSGKWRSCYKYASNNDGTGQIVYVPIDKDGNPIVGDPYPMQMWMPQFGFYL